MPVTTGRSPSTARGPCSARPGEQRASPAVGTAGRVRPGFLERNPASVLGLCLAFRSLPRTANRAAGAGDGADLI